MAERNLSGSRRTVKLRILKDLTMDQVHDVLRKVISVEVDTDTRIDMGFRQEAWRDRSFDAYPFKVKYDWDDINPYSIDERSYPGQEALRKKVVAEKLGKQFDRDGGSSWGALRWDAGGKVVEIINMVSWKGLVIVENSTGLSD